MADGTPKKELPMEVESLARAYTKRSIHALGSILENSPEEGNRIRAADILLDRGWGRPRQQQDNKQEHTGSVEIILRDIAAEKAAAKKS